MSEAAVPKRRRFKVAAAKPGEMKVSYGRADEHSSPSLVYSYGAYGAYKGHTRVLMEAFESVKLPGGLTLVETLKDDGFDVTTIKFSVVLAPKSSAVPAPAVEPGVTDPV